MTEEFLFKIGPTQIYLFLKSHHLGKCFYLIVLYIIGYNNISWRSHHPHDPIPKYGGRDPQLQDDRLQSPHTHALLTI